MIPHSKPSLDKRDFQVVNQVLSSGHIVQGRQVEQFEKEMARYSGHRSGVAVSSGTVALKLSLMALGVKEGDEVMIPSYVCAALWHAVQSLQAKPVLLDMDPDTFELDPDEIRRKKTRKTRALILVHSFGYPINMLRYTHLEVPIIEDVANSLGAEFQRQKVGKKGRLAITSFYATKMMTTGEGGMVLCDSPQSASEIRNWRSYDERGELGLAFNYKMTDFQAALGRAQLKRFPSFVQKRRRWAQFYSKSLSHLKGLVLPTLSQGSKPCYHRFVFRHKRASWLIRALNKKGICARKPIFKPLHAYLGAKRFPGSEILSREMISVPIYPTLTQKEAKMIVKTLNQLLGD